MNFGGSFELGGVDAFEEVGMADLSVLDNETSWTTDIGSLSKSLIE